jgi:hypothetical protein
MGYKEIARFYRKHTKALEVDMESIKTAVEKVLEETRDAVKAYRKLVQLELNEEIAEAIAKSKLPRKVLPDYIETEKDKLVRWDSSKDLWTVYNDISAAIWHSAIDVDTKVRHFNILHTVIPVIRVE